MTATSWETAWNLLSQSDALEVPVAEFKAIGNDFRDGKKVIGSAGFTACYAVVIKIAQNVGLGHIMVWSEGDRAAKMVKHWGDLARQHGGRAWIWVPYENGVVQQMYILDGIRTALGLPQERTTEVRRDRAETDLTDTRSTAMAISQTQIVMGTCHEQFH